MKQLYTVLAAEGAITYTDKISAENHPGNNEIIISTLSPNNNFHVIGLAIEDIQAQVEDVIANEDMEAFVEYLEKEYSYSDMFEGLDDYASIFNDHKVA